MPNTQPVSTAEKRVNRAMFFIGAVCVLVGARFLFLPDELNRTSIGRALPGYWDEAWSWLYLAGGLLTMLGVGARRPRLELPGITLTATATIANGAALILIAGSRAWSQMPLYAIALWVFSGRSQDLRELPRERRSRFCQEKQDTERRTLVMAAPIIGMLIGAQAHSDASLITTAIVAILGGGIFTAFAQLLLYRPQRRKLEGELSRMSVETARDMLGEARKELAETKQELAAAEARIDALEDERATLRNRIAALEQQSSRDHDTITQLLERARRTST
jgi:hypothetical protein